MSDIEDDDIPSGVTSTLLGFAEEEASDVQKTTEDDNLLGGLPVWLNGEEPDAEMVTCKSCKEPMSLVVQISAPLDDELCYKRNIYVFVCAKTQCARKEGYAKAIKGVWKKSAANEKKEDTGKDSSKKTNIGDNLFGGPSGSNPFAEKPVANLFAKPANKPQEQSQEQLQTTQKESSGVSDSKQVKKNLLGLPNTFRSYYISVEEEYIEEVTIPNSKIEVIDPDVLDETPEIEDESSGSANSATGASGSKITEIDEKQTAAFAGDSHFQKFIQVVEQNPEQVVRYHREGAPLLYKGDDAVAKYFSSNPLPSNRVFELQVTPYAIMKLETDEQLEDGMEWGSIFVATKANEKIEGQDEGVYYQEEWCGVQWE